MITLSYLAFGIVLIAAFLLGMAVTLNVTTVRNSTIIRRGVAQNLRNAETLRRAVDAAIARGEVDVIRVEVREGDGVAPGRVH